MARKLFTDRVLTLDEINEKIERIENSDTDFVSENGNIYSMYGENKFLKKKTHVNKYNGYTYCGIHYKGGNKQRRVHILVAKAFMDNKENLPYVGHKHNNKSCVKADELYWTDARENTKRAYDDGKAKNCSGFEDSQSFPIDVYKKGGVFLKSVGSVSIAAKEFKVSKSTVLRHCRKEIKIVRIDYEFRFQGEAY